MIIITKFKNHRPLERHTDRVKLPSIHTKLPVDHIKIDQTRRKLNSSRVEQFN